MNNDADCMRKREILHLIIKIDKYFILFHILNLLKVHKSKNEKKRMHYVRDEPAYEFRLFTVEIRTLLNGIWKQCEKELW